MQHPGNLADHPEIEPRIFLNSDKTKPIGQAGRILHKLKHRSPLIHLIEHGNINGTNELRDLDSLLVEEIEAVLFAGDLVVRAWVGHLGAGLEVVPAEAGEYYWH